MKKLQTTLIILFLSVTIINAQQINTEFSSENKAPFLLGKINKEGLSEKTYSEWFLKNYKAYQPNESKVTSIKENLSEYTITAFMGTWCGDSKREVPHFYKVLEASNFPLERLTMIAVSRESETYKQSPGGEHEGLNIHRVPTFIFYKDGVEVNRIVESPVNNIEEDIEQIINNNYKSNYQSVSYINHFIKENGIQKFIKKSKKLSKIVAKLTNNMYELNTYSNVLFYANKKEEAIEVARINAKIFPNESYVYISLASKLARTNKKEAAISLYQKALELDPENENIKESLNQLKNNLN